MDISISQESGRVPVTVVCVRGDIDAATSDAFLARVREAYAEGATDVLLDLSEVPYISSWGVRALSDLYRMLRSGSEDVAPDASAGPSRHLKLLNPNPAVKHVLFMAGLDSYLQSFTDRKLALQSF